MTDMDDLMTRVLVFVDRKGTVLEKYSTPMSSALKMKYVSADITIQMHAFAHGMGNGSCGATVKYKGKKVFEAGGRYTAKPYNVKATTYHPGVWEKSFPSVQ